jgi:hypothetical protein
MTAPQSVSPDIEAVPLPARMRDFIKSGITQFKEHELREIVAVFCRLPGIAPSSFFASLTPDQQKAALEYDGPENHGDDRSLVEAAGVPIPTEVADLRRYVIELREWKAAILDKCKASDGFEQLEWGGDKEGWGFVHYFIGHLETRALHAETVLAEQDARPLAQPSGEQIHDLRIALEDVRALLVAPDLSRPLDERIRRADKRIALALPSTARAGE